MLGEIMPTRLLSKAYSMFISLKWIGSIAIGLLTLTAIEDRRDGWVQIFSEH